MRKLSVNVYATGIIYTLIVIALGFLGGMYYSNHLFNEVREELDMISESVSTTQALLSMSKEEFCEAYPYIMPKLEEITWKLGEKLEFLEESREVPKSLKMRYFDLEFRDMYVVEKAEKVCGENATIIMYFYTNSEEKRCYACEGEGAQITFARKELIEEGVRVKVYVFDGELGHPLVELYKKRFGVESYPTIVVMRGKNIKVLRGYVDKEGIKEAVFSTYQTSSSSS